MTDPEPRPLTDAELLAWAVVLGYREQQQRDGLSILGLSYPPCPTCGGEVHGITVWSPIDRFIGSASLAIQPCEHVHTATADDLERIREHASAMVRAIRAADDSHDSNIPRWMTDDIIREAHVRVGEPEPAATEATDPAKSPLREQIYRAMKDRYLDNVLDLDNQSPRQQINSLTDAALTVVLSHGKFLGDELRNSEACRAAERTALHEVLGHFVHKGHPGEPCLSSGWISERTVARWRAVLHPPKPAPDSGPTVAEAARDDRRWALEKGGE
jgi:hypothetical protein